MKRTLFTCIWLIALIAVSAKTYGQQNNTLSVIYGTGSDGVFSGSPGAAGYSGKGFTMLGLNYVHHISGLLSIETGLEYSNNNVLWDYEDAYDPTFRPQRASIKMLSVPVYANLTFFKYAFLNAGLSVDLETDHPAQRIAPEQNGIGMFLGIGGKYAFKHIVLLANPFVQVHNMVSFQKYGGHNLMNSGFRFGIGYGF
jgi:hypothetical protein